MILLVIFGNFCVKGPEEQMWNENKYIIKLSESISQSVSSTCLIFGHLHVRKIFQTAVKFTLPYMRMYWLKYIDSCQNGKIS